MTTSPKWHTMPLPDVLDSLKTDAEQGLSEQEAASRLTHYGPNALREQPRPSFWMRLLAQFQSFVIYILIFAAILSAPCRIMDGFGCLSDSLTKTRSLKRHEQKTRDWR